MELLEGTAYLGDYVSIMKVVDVFQGVKRRMFRVQKKLEVFFQGLIDRQRGFRNRNSSGNKENKNLLDRMLSLQETDPEFYTDETIKATIMVCLSLFFLFCFFFFLFFFFSFAILIGYVRGESK